MKETRGLTRKQWVGVIECVGRREQGMSVPEIANTLIDTVRKCNTEGVNKGRYTYHTKTLQTTILGVVTVGRQNKEMYPFVLEKETYKPILDKLPKGLLEDLNRKGLLKHEIA